MIDYQTIAVDVADTLSKLVVSLTKSRLTKTRHIVYSGFSLSFSPRLLRGAPLRSARNLPSTPPELLCICIVRVYTESYVDSQNSLFCLLTCNNDHNSLYMPILWYVIISPNLM